MPTVNPRESRKDFVSRCVPTVLEELGTKSAAHAAAKCGGIYDRSRKLTANRTKIVPGNPLKADPTRTKTLRRVFEDEFNRRFWKLKNKIWQLVAVEDAFGLTQTQNRRTTDEASEDVRARVSSEHLSTGGAGERGVAAQDLSDISVKAVTQNEESQDGRYRKRVDSSLKKDGKHPRRSEQEHVSDGEGDQQTVESDGTRELRESDSECLNTADGKTRKVTANIGRWAARSDPRKVKAFEKWLRTQIQSDIITVTEAKAQNAYWRKYVEEGYKKGAGRAFDDVRKPALASGAEQLAFFEGTRDEFLRQSFARPVAIGKVKFLAGRVFTDLSNVTEVMSDKITRQLTDGLARGANPREIARRMIEDGIGTKRRGVQSRALTIARTEVVRAHAEGQLDALEDLGVTEVGVMVEWSTAGDDRVCPLCSALHGVVLTIKEARGILPRHPNCRCAHIPANVGEDKKKQKRGKTEVKSAFDSSIAAERKKGSLAEKREKSQWLGAGKTIAKKRPRSAL